LYNITHHNLEFWNRQRLHWSVFSQFVFTKIGKGHFEIPKTWFNDGTMKRITDAIANTMRMLSL
jgi:hypothetical protein